MWSSAAVVAALLDVDTGVDDYDCDYDVVDDWNDRLVVCTRIDLAQVLKEDLLAAV